MQASTVITSVRELLQDKVGPTYRYSDESLLSILNEAIMEARRIRPDFFLGQLRTDIPFLTELGGTIPLPQWLMGPLINFVSGRAEMRDDEYANDKRAITLYGAFMAALSKGTLMSATIDNIYDTCQTRLAGVDTPLILKEINHAVENFFMRSGAWANSQKMNLVAGKTRYIVLTPHPTIRVQSVIAVGGPGARYSTDLYFSDALLGSPLRAVFEPPSFLKLLSAPTVAGEISFDTILVPTNAEAVPEPVLERHREALTDLTLSRMFGIPSKPWSNEKLWSMHGRLANNAIATAKRDAQRGYGNANWRFPAFA